MTRSLRSRPTRAPRGPRVTTLPQLISSAVEMNPDGIALTFADAAETLDRLTYAELDTWSNRLARALIARGIGPEDRVAIGIPRSVESVVAIWAVAKTGAGFVPFDPADPVDWINEVIADADVVFGLTVVAVADALPGRVQWLRLDTPEAERLLDNYSPDPVTYADRVRPLRAQHPAYLSYTADARGNPNGVVVTQAGLAGLCAEQRERYRVTDDSNTLHFASPSFDAAVLELLLAVGGAANMVVAAPTISTGGELTALLRREGVTHAVLPPLVLDAIDLTGLDELQVVVTGGEVSADLVRRWVRPIPEGMGELYHGYGAPETTVMTNISAPLVPEEPVTIGPPIRGVTAYVLDERLARVPVGEVGELYITGPQVARGYYGRPAHTASRFVADPFGDGGRLYRTGDLVRWTDHGGLEHLGRTDYIDPVPAADVPAEPARPAAVEPAPEPAVSSVAAEPVAPQSEFLEPTDTRTAVAMAYSEVLAPAQPVTAETDFFEVGGNFHTANRVAARLGELLGITVSAQLIFELPVVTELAARLDSLIPADDRSELVPVRAERAPLSGAQEWLWWSNRSEPDGVRENLAFVVRLPGTLNLSALCSALGDVVERQESLRTVYPEVDGIGYQQVLPPDRVACELVPEPVAEDALVDWLRRLAAVEFDITAQVPVRFALAELGSTDHALAVVLHRICADRASIRPFLRDLAQAFLARRNRAVPTWPPLRPQYIEYTIRQRELLGDEYDPESPAGAQLAYWAAELADLPHELNLPVDRPRPTTPSFAGVAADFVIDASTRAGLAELARAHGVTLFTVLHTALAVFLARISGAGDIVIGTQVARRGDAELEQVIGPFANTVVLRTRVQPRSTFVEVLAAHRENAQRAFARADIPFERLAAELDPEPAAGRHPLCQVALSYEDPTVTGLELPGVPFTASAPEFGPTTYDLRLVVRETAGAEPELAAELTGAHDLFDEATVQRFGRRFQRLLAAVVRDADREVGYLELLDEAEYAELTHRAGGPAAPARVLPDLLADAVAANPDGVAVVAGGRSFTYFELDTASTQLARVLIDRGAGPGVPVAVALRRSLESVLAVWAVVKTGAMLVSVDPTYPPERVGHMLADSRAALGITLSVVLTDLPLLPGGWITLDDRALIMDVTRRSAAPITDSDRHAPIHPATAGYVVYPFRSPGAVEGVVVPHSGLANLRAELVDRYGLDTATRALAFASPSSEAALLELLLAVGAAGTLVVAPAESTGGAELAELISGEHITHAYLTPSVLASLDSEAVAGLRVVITGGEPVPAELAAHWAKVPGRALHNGYGPAETTIMATAGDPLVPGGPLTIGGPIRGMRALVLDDRLRPVPEGVVGELYLGGVQLARGYHDRARATAARFVADPYAVGERLHRTGDVVRWRGGALEYIGRRITHQEEEVRLETSVRPELAARYESGAGYEPTGYHAPVGHAAAGPAATAYEATGYDGLGSTAAGYAADHESIGHPIPDHEGVGYAAGFESSGHAVPDHETAGRTAARYGGVGGEGTGHEAAEHAAGYAGAGDEVAGYRTAGHTARHVSVGNEVVDSDVAGRESAGNEVGGSDAVGHAGIGNGVTGHDIAGRAIGREGIDDEVVGHDVAGRTAARYGGAGDEAAGPAPVESRPAEHETAARYVPADYEKTARYAPVDYEATARYAPITGTEAARSGRGAMTRDTSTGAQETLSRHAAARHASAEPGGITAVDLPATPTALRLLGGATPGIEVRAITLDIPRECPLVHVETAAREILEQHPMLRAHMDPDTGALRILPEVTDDSPFSRSLPGPGGGAVPIDEVVRAAAAELDPTVGRNIRFVASGTSEATRLVVVANGLVVDDHSWRIIVDRLAAAWDPGRLPVSAATETGVVGLLRDLADRAFSPHIAEEARWWRRLLATAAPTLPLGATDLRPRRRVSLTITTEGAAAVAGVAELYGATVPEVLLTAVAVALRTAAQEAVPRMLGSVVRLEADGRTATRPDVGAVVGGFHTEFPLPLRLNGIDTDELLIGGPAAGAAITQIKELHRSVPASGIGYALLRYSNPNADVEPITGDPGRFALRYRDLRPAEVHTDAPPDGLLLTLTVDVTDNGLLTRFDYATEVFAAEEVKTFAEHWVWALGGLAEHGLRPAQPEADPDTGGESHDQPADDHRTMVLQLPHRTPAESRRRGW
ncbi:AMP-binding protein [Nocardia paucivorans]|uniref:AMP-binding protein n=1 Tax=Nocardia paucivorans TaxID=114259 RepID=UPI0002EC1CDC|nr:AMP-binding protein [Nocardia paucivorans]